MAFLPAALGAGASILGGITGGKGASAAAKAQAQSQANALAEQKREYNTNQANFAPYIQAGQGALGGQQTLLGLNGNTAQQSAIDALKAGPQFTSQYNTGLDAINQNAAATGGLRGGNTALAQSNFGSSLLGTVIQNQLGNLGGLSSLGAGAAGTAGGLGQQNANAQTGIYGQMGNTNAAAASAPYAGFLSGLNGVQNSGVFNAFGGSNGAANAATGSGILNGANTFLANNTYNPLGNMPIRF